MWLWILIAFVVGFIFGGAVTFLFGRMIGEEREREEIASFLESIVIHEAHDKRLIAMFVKAIRKRGQKQVPDA